MAHRPGAVAALLAALALVTACGGGGGEPAGPTTVPEPVETTTEPPGTEPPVTDPPATDPAATDPPRSTAPATTARPRTTRPATTSTGVAVTSTTSQGPVRLEVGEVASRLETVWSLAWDPEGRLWFTERPGRVTRLGEGPRSIGDVVEQGEGGLMGVEFDRQGRMYVMYTGRNDNRVVRLEPAGGQTVLVDGIRKAAIHNGGRLRLGPDGMLYVSTGDAADTSLPQDDGSLNGKILRLDPQSGSSTTFAKGLRNSQGLCFAPDGRLLSTEHGPNRGDEVNVLTEGFNGGWPDTTGTGIRNYTPTIAPAGCAVYDADLIPGWRGSMLFVTLKERDLRRLTFGPGGEVSGEEILFDGRFGRLRDVAVGPDGAVYLATSNRDGRGSPQAGDDRILRVAPAP
jgi:aldose sugar dehydrogenase